MRMYANSFFGIIFVILSSASSTLASQVHECDRLAANKSDPQRISRDLAVTFFELDHTAAIAACSKALNEELDPATASRMRYQLGRANAKACFKHDDTEACKSAERAYIVASQSNHYQAYHGLGDLHENGKLGRIDFRLALTYYQLGVNKNNYASMVDLADLLSKGIGIERDCDRAINLLRDAEKGGYSQASHFLGILYREGRCVDQNNEIAIGYFERGADEDSSACAYTNFGDALIRRRRNQEDINKAIELYEKSANLGCGVGMRNLGNLYRAGVYVARNDAKAVELFRRSADQKETRGMLDLASMLRVGRIGKDNLEPDASGANELNKKARLNAQRGAELGNIFEMEQLARMLWEGVGGPKDQDQAIEWTKRAADQGLSDAINYLGYLYNSRDQWAEANIQFKRGMDYGNTTAEANLGLNMCYGRGFETKNCAEGIKLLKSAGSRGNTFALKEIAKLMVQSKNFAEARQHLDQAVALNDADAMIRLVEMLEDEDIDETFFPYDERLIADLLNKAARLGSHKAYFELGVRAAYKIIDENITLIDCISAMQQPIKLLHDAISFGSSAAHLVLADIFEKTCAEDLNKAISSLRDSSKLGEQEADRRLAALYLRENSDTFDQRAGIEIIERNMNAGNIWAIALMGQYYAEGKHLQKDLVKGVELLERAVKADYQPAMAILGRGLVLGFGEGIGTDTPRGIELLEKAAAKNNSHAQLYLGAILLEGTQVKQDALRGFKLLQSAAKDGHDRALAMLANYCIQNQEQMQRLSECLVWFRNQAIADVVPAMGVYGWLLVQGENSNDKSEGLKWLQKAYDAKHPIGTRLFGLSIHLGLSQKKDERLGRDILVEASNLGDLTAKAFLGECIVFDCHISVAQAATYLRESIESGNRSSIAIRNLGLWLVVPNLHTTPEQLAKLTFTLIKGTGWKAVSEMPFLFDPKAKQSPRLMQALERELHQAGYHKPPFSGRMNDRVKAALKKAAEDR